MSSGKFCVKSCIRISPIWCEIHKKIRTMWDWQFNTIFTWDYQLEGLITKHCHRRTGVSISIYEKFCVKSCIRISPIVCEIHKLICTMWGGSLTLLSLGTTNTATDGLMILRKCIKFGKHCVRSSSIFSVTFYNVIIHAHTNILKMGRLHFCYHLNDLTVHQGNCFNMQYLF